MSLTETFDAVDYRDFAPTLPLSCDLSLVFGPLGADSIRVSIVAVASMGCETCLCITEAGSLCEPPALGSDGRFAAAIATIVHLNHASREQTLTRQLDRQRWVFAWRLDERSVAVAEVDYREDRDEQTTVDIAVMRRVCEAEVAGCRAGAALEADAVCATAPQPLPIERPEPARPSAAAGQGSVFRALSMPVFGADEPRASEAPQVAPVRTPAAPATAAAAGATQTAPSRSAAWRPLAGRRPLLAGLLATYAAVAVGITLIGRHGDALNAEAARFRGQSDATMLARIAPTLADGDYGEVQAEIDELAVHKYFVGAVVTNARGRIVATVGHVPVSRIGDVPSAEVLQSARVMPLMAGGQSPVGQLLLWGAAEATPHPWADRGRLGAVGVMLCAALTAAALTRRPRPLVGSAV